jgi:hypothetical protein
MANFKKEIETILKDGIKEYGTRYHTQEKLVWYYWSHRYTKEECYESIREWYYSHNHQSKDWQKSPDRVLRNLKSAIESLYRNAQSKGYQPHSNHNKYLTVGDVRNIVQMTSDYRMQKFIFSLLEYALRTRDSKNRFRLPIKAILKFECCSWRSYSEKMEFCESVGLIQKVREYYRQQGRARTYLTNYTFNKDSEQVNSLEEGLKDILDSKTLKLTHSWRVRGKIRKA